MRQQLPHLADLTETFVFSMAILKILDIVALVVFLWRLREDKYISHSQPC